MDSSQIFSSILGIATLLGLVGYKHWSQQRKLHRLRTLWEEGEVSFQAGRLDRAAKAYQDAILLEGLWLPPRQRLAQVHALQGKLDLAEQELKMAAALRPREPEGPIALAAFYVQHVPTRRAEALRLLQQAFALDPAAGKLLQQYREHFQPLEEDVVYQELLKGNEQA